jgi:DNA-directed RNA polymerase sigma subunit (sigma70/sigma32)
LDRVSEGVQVRALVAGLARPLRAVIIWRYGLDGRGEATFGEIGAELGVTRQRAEQLHQQALLCLADPARSTALRRQMGRNTVADYRAYLARRRAWQRRGRMVR